MDGDSATSTRFGAPVRRGRPALLVVDVQEGFTRPPHACAFDMSAAVAATDRLLRTARAAGHPVALTVISYDSAGEARLRWPKVPAVAELVTGTAGVDLERQLSSGPGDAVFVKKGPSAFHRTEVASWLSAHRVDTVVVCGATTSGCVRASVVDAMQLGFSALVVREAVADRDSASELASLRDIEQKYGDVVAIDEACVYLAEGRR